MLRRALQSECEVNSGVAKRSDDEGRYWDVERHRPHHYRGSGLSEGEMIVPPVIDPGAGAAVADVAPQRWAHFEGRQATASRDRRERARRTTPQAGFHAIGH
jgi:hypothetical protein